MKIGGKVVGSGGFGCVFRPAIKCKGQARTKKRMVSKLMTTKHAKNEYTEIQKFKKLLHKIPNYAKYFMLDNITLCKPDKLSSNDLIDFSKKCNALNEDYSQETINESIVRSKSLMALTIPDGGMDLQDFVKIAKYKDVPKINNILIDLLLNGIIPMNKQKVLHADIKDSNILMDGKRAILIDWGLSVHYKLTEIPKRLCGRSIYYNSPFSIILFNNIFNELYAKFLKEPGIIQTRNEFIQKYILEFFEIRGKGHYKTIKQIFFCLFISTPNIDENQITMEHIINYISVILDHFTVDGKFDALSYYKNVYVHIIDIWGLLTTYISFLEVLSTNYTKLSRSELVLYEAIKKLLITHLYAPQITPYDIDAIVFDLKALNPLFENCSISGESTINFSTSSYKNNLSDNPELKVFSKKQTKKIVNRMFSSSKTKSHRM